VLFRSRATLDDLQRIAGDCEVVVGRELTKVHEQLVRGPISTIASQLIDPRGEFTVVVNIGLTPNKSTTSVDIVAEFSQMTTMPGITKRRAVAELARKHGLATNEVYTAIENARRAVK